jgi:hypothetical protein
MPETYSFNKTTKKWKKRVISKDPKRAEKRKKTFGRILPVSPRDPERFALYLLMKHFPGDDKHLITVDGHICESFGDAARRRGLLEDNQVWEKILKEAANSLNPSQMRQLFANILVFGSTENCIIDGPLLWNKFLIHMYDRRCTDDQRAVRIDRALALLERLLIAQGRLLTEFGLPLPNVSLANDPDRAIDEFFFPQHVCDDEMDETVDTTAFEHNKLNDEQKLFFNLIRDAVLTSPENTSVDRLFFLSGDGGTGKTFLLNFILYHLRSLGKKVLATASTGIASTKFYYGGMTAHSAFRFGIDIEPGKIPSIPLDSFFARRIIECDLIIIDEITILNRTLLENIDLLLRTLIPERKHIPFAGKAYIISGDWQQSLPVGDDSYSMEEQIAICAQSSPLYPLFRKFRLYQNMRISSADREHLDWLKQIGTGQMDMVAIPPDMIVNSREELISHTFNNRFDLPSDQLLSRLMLATTNAVVDLNNSIILDRFDTPFMDYFSIDKPLSENPFAINAADYEVANLNRLTPKNLPAHHIRLYVGCVIMLLVSLNTSKSLCNGTRLIVRKLEPGLIIAETITGTSSNKGVLVGIPRIPNTYKDKRPDGVSFERFQLPVRVAFTMTITKAQGQTCQHLGIDFTEEPFAHGQLYTALSRCTNRNNIKIYAPNKPRDENGNVLIRNVVCKDIQFH